MKIFTIIESKDDQIHPVLTFPITLEESYPDSLIEYGNQSLMVSIDGMKELNGFKFEVKPNEILHPKGSERVQHPKSQG